jgi:hypothetical protein
VPPTAIPLKPEREGTLVVYEKRQHCNLYVSTLVSVQRFPAPAQDSAYIEIHIGESAEFVAKKGKETKNAWINRGGSNCSVAAWIFRFSRYYLVYSLGPGFGDYFAGDAFPAARHGRRLKHGSFPTREPGLARSQMLQKCLEARASGR